MEMKVLSAIEACEKTRALWLRFNGIAVGAFSLGKATFRL